MVWREYVVFTRQEVLGSVPHGDISCEWLAPFVCLVFLLGAVPNPPYLAMCACAHLPKPFWKPAFAAQACCIFWESAHAQTYNKHTTQFCRQCVFLWFLVWAFGKGCDQKLTTLPCQIIPGSFSNTRLSRTASRDIIQHSCIYDNECHACSVFVLTLKREHLATHRQLFEHQG